MSKTEASNHVDTSYTDDYTASILPLGLGKMASLAGAGVGAVAGPVGVVVGATVGASVGIAAGMAANEVFGTAPKRTGESSD